MRAIDRLEQELRAAAAREAERSAPAHRVRRSRRRLPSVAFPVAAALALVALALFVVVPAVRGPVDREQEIAAPAGGEVPEELLGSFARGSVTVIFDFERYTLDTAAGQVFGDVEPVAAGLRLTHDGAGLCGTVGDVAGLYTYRVRGDELTLSALDDPCGPRRRALSGGVFRRGG